MTDIGWVYWSDGEHGPFDDDNLALLVREGRIDPATDIRRANQVAWTPAGTLLPDLFPQSDQTQLKAQQGRWTDTKAHPWRRYAARMVDSLVVGGLIGFVLGIVFFSTAPEQAQGFFSALKTPAGRLLDLILTQLVVIPINAFAIGLSGLTLGKWMFGVRVLKDGNPIGVLRAFRREFSVFVFGLGAGLPLVSLFTLIRSSMKLSDTRSTRWDRAQKLTVVHRPESRAAKIGMIAAVIFLVLGRLYLQFQAVQ